MCNDQWPVGVLSHRGTPQSSSIFDWDFPWNKTSILGPFINRFSMKYNVSIWGGSFINGCSMKYFTFSSWGYPMTLEPPLEPLHLGVKPWGFFQQAIADQQNHETIPEVSSKNWLQLHLGRMIHWKKLVGWLVSSPLWKMGLRQLGWWLFPIFLGNFQIDGNQSPPTRNGSDGDRFLLVPHQCSFCLGYDEGLPVSDLKSSGHSTLQGRKQRISAP